MTEAIHVVCPRCGGSVQVTQVQGDRCPGCQAEFKLFAPGEERTAQDYLAVLTGWKSLLPGENQTTLIAHE